MKSKYLCTTITETILGTCLISRLKFLSSGRWRKKRTKKVKKEEDEENSKSLSAVSTVETISEVTAAAKEDPSPDGATDAAAKEAVEGEGCGNEEEVKDEGIEADDEADRDSEVKDEDNVLQDIEDGEDN